MSRGSAARSVAALSAARNRPAMWSRDGVLPLEGMTYFEHLDTVLPDGGRGPLPRGGSPYPDDEPPKPGGVRWAAGAFEGVMSLRGGIGSGPEPMLAAAAIEEACRLPLGTVAVHTVAERLAALPDPSDVDRLTDELRIDSVVGRMRLAELARWLCRFGTRRRHVQVGLALLSTVGGPQDRDLVMRLGLLDVLTRWAVEALRGMLPDPEPSVFDLAKQSDGWGRIHAVHGLRGTTTPAVQDWLLRGGYDSGVIDEELAGIAAISGDLAGALQGDVDAELLHHAGRLLEALRWGGPAEDLRDYPEGGLAIELYLGHAAEAPPSVEVLSVVQILHRYLCEVATGNPHLDELSCVRLLRLTTALLERSEWFDVAEAALRSPEIRDFRLAVVPAERLGIDVRPRILDRLERDPAHPYLWQCVVSDVTPVEAAESYGLAERLLDVTNLATGATLELLPHEPIGQCLDTLVSHLDEHPGLGWSLIAAGLENPSTRIRHVALRAFRSWPTEAWPPEAPALLERLRWVEPDRSVRTMLVEMTSTIPAAAPDPALPVPTNSHARAERT